MRELDAKVADKVMGWKVHGRPFPGPGHWVTDKNGAFIGNIDGGEVNEKHWRPSVDAAADYEVLKRVRETWTDEQQDNFEVALEDIMIAKESNYPNTWHVILYEPGDWSRAALKALGEDI